jgi:hypothetical protein
MLSKRTISNCSIEQSNVDLTVRNLKRNSPASASAALITPCGPSPKKIKKSLSFEDAKGPLSFVNSISSQSSNYSSSANSVISSKISTPRSCENDKKLHVLTPKVTLEKLSPESLKNCTITNKQQVSQQLERNLKFGLGKGKVLPMPPNFSEYVNPYDESDDEDSIEVEK